MAVTNVEWFDVYDKKSQIFFTVYVIKLCFTLLNQTIDTNLTFIDEGNITKITKT